MRVCHIETIKLKGKKGKGSWICIAPHCEKLASEALRHASHSFYAATTPHLLTYLQFFGVAVVLMTQLMCLVAYC